MMATLFWSIPPLPNPQNLRGDLWLGEGGFLEIVNYWHILSVKPAPTKSLLQNSQRASNTIDCFHGANFIECLLKITFPNIVSHDDNFCEIAVNSRLHN